MDFKNQVIIITGASKGLGKELALLLAQQGARLALMARDEAALDRVQKKCGEGSRTYVCNIHNSENVRTAVDSVMSDFGRIDCVVNNAGIWLQGATEDADPERIQAVFDTNIVGQIFVTQAVLPYFKKQNSGHILNISSKAGLNPNAGWGIYCASKYALRGFTESLKLELAETDIKVSGFYPGGINTDLFTTAGNEASNEPWMMQTKDVAEVLVFMLSRPDDVVLDGVAISKVYKEW